MKAFKQYGGFIALLFVVLAVVMLFIEPALTYKLGNSTNEVKVTAFKVMFGNKEDKVDANVLGIVSAILLVAGAVVPFLKLDGSLKGFIAAIALIVAAILLIVFPTTIKSAIGPITVGEFKAGKMLIVSAVFAVLGGGVNLVLALAK